jgi:transposase
MSLPKHTTQRTIFDTPQLVDELFDADDRYRLFRAHITPLLWQLRERLAALYCDDNGRAAIEPVLMAGVTVLQYLENVPDRRAVELVRLHLGWKFALEMPLAYDGFHPTSLVTFRERLIAKGQEGLLFDAVVSALQDAGLIKRRNKQRLDSTHILGNVARLSRLELLRETVRLGVELIARARGPRPHNWAVLCERYGETDVDWRCQDKEKLTAKIRQAGLDGYAVLRVLEGHAVLRKHAHTAILRRVLEEQLELTAQGVAQKPKEAAGAVKNPHDPEAQWAAKDSKKETQWVGYKAQVAETVNAPLDAKEDGAPTSNFIVDITTTAAIASDKDGMQRSLQAQAARGLEYPTEHFVDGAYVSGATLAQAQHAGAELVGPMQAAPQRAQGIYPTEAFDVDTARRVATCPAGKVSTEFGLINDAYQNTSYYRIQWGRQCDQCERQAQCTTSGQQRRVLCVGVQHALIQARRREMLTPAFKQRMHQRNAIEGTISELTRNGMRRTRYRGLAKTKLANYFHGAACNIRRWLRLLAWASVPGNGGDKTRGFFSTMAVAAAAT